MKHNSLLSLAAALCGLLAATPTARAGTGSTFAGGGGYSGDGRFPSNATSSATWSSSAPVPRPGQRPEFRRVMAP